MSELDLRSAREAAGLSQTEVAVKLGVAQTTVSAWERGRIEISIGDLIDYAGAVGVPAADLYVGGPDTRDIAAAYGAGWDDCAAAVLAATDRRGRRAAS